MGLCVTLCRLITVCWTLLDVEKDSILARRTWPVLKSCDHAELKPWSYRMHSSSTT